MSDTVITATHEVRRLRIAAGSPFEEFRRRYEEAVPALDVRQLGRFREVGASWDEVRAAAAINAPHGFIIFWSQDVAATMRLAGHQGQSVQYLMGNHTIAETMYRHDPGVMLYAPLRTEIHTDAHGETWFCLDQPSTQFAAFGRPEITAVGHELDAKLAALLEFLEAPVPDVLRARTAQGR